VSIVDLPKALAHDQARKSRAFGHPSADADGQIARAPQGHRGHAGRTLRVVSGGPRSIPTPAERDGVGDPISISARSSRPLTGVGNDPYGLTILEEDD